MLARTRGPSRKPAWAATTSSAASEKRVTTTNAEAEGRAADDALDQHGVHRLAGTGETRQSR